MSVKIESLIQEFEKEYGKGPVWGASAPGRVNLIGEHIDYNGGWVFPAAINRETTLLAGPSETGRSVIRSLSYEKPFEWDSQKVPPGQVEPSWANYFLGALDQMAERGYVLPPIEVLVGGDVPTAAGLSSSAAFLVGIFSLFEGIFDIEIAGPDKALWSQAAEHADRLQIRSGIMDQFISANAVEGHALKLNCGTLDSTPVPLDPEQFSMLIIHSTVPRELMISAYNQRRLECESALEHLNKASGLDEPFLIGYTTDELEQFGVDLDETLFKRARHVMSEQTRVERFEEVLEENRLEEVGDLLTESHMSLRDDYEVSCPELNAIQEMAGHIEGVYGCRMTGAGFGGCAVALVVPGEVDRISAEIENTFENQFGKRPWTLSTPAHSGARRLSLG